jgi:NADH-quinone oxidoreductase subunit A
MEISNFLSQVLNIPITNIELSAYFPILIFLAVAITLSLVIIVIPFLFALKKPDQEKLSPYECGFEPEGQTRNEFNIQFYLVAILFIIFDLEIAFLFPWAVSLKTIGVFGFWSMMIFLSLLTIGFIYEWKRGALEWK